MTEEQIIKALEICYTPGSLCDGCSLKDSEDCNDNLMENALELIKSQRAENDDLKQELDRLKSGIRNLIKELGGE